MDGKILTKEFCINVISEFKVPTTPTIKEEVFKRCLDSLMDYALINFDGGIKMFEEIILNISTSKKDYWVYKKSGKDNFNPRDYQLWCSLSNYDILCS